MILLAGRCREHRDGLAQLADPDRLGEPPEALLDHLDACPRCHAEGEAAIRTVHGLRRLAAEADRATLSPGGWPRLRARVDRPSERRWSWLTSVAGLAVGSALVATILAPAAVWPERIIRLEESGTDPSAVTAFRRAEVKAEAALIDEWRFVRPNSPVAGTTRAGDPGAPTPTAVEIGWTGPDGRGVTPIRLVAASPPADRTM